MTECGMKRYPLGLGQEVVCAKFAGHIDEHLDPVAFSRRGYVWPNLRAVPDQPKPPASILAEAEAIIAGARETDYGKAEDSFQVIAQLWNTYIEDNQKRGGGQLSGRDVALMLILMKVARDGHKSKRDNLVDIAGYAALAEKCED